jgi:hypothetical protein
MKKVIAIIVIVAAIAAFEILAVLKTGVPNINLTDILSVISTSTTDMSDQIVVTSPAGGMSVSSPLTVIGRARGNWFFEASFPVFVVDWDGRIIGQGIAHAKGDWTTTDFVPFEAMISFDKPVDVGPQSLKGTVILKNDNPSGQASTSKSMEIPILFK